MDCPRGKVTLVAFVLLYTVRFQMSPQIARLIGFKVILVAFVWLFSNVRYEMRPQMSPLIKRLDHSRHSHIS